MRNIAENTPTISSAYGLEVPPNTQIYQRGKKISHPAGGWRFLVLSCPYCGRRHIHKWSTNRRIRLRFSKCSIKNYYLETIHLPEDVSFEQYELSNKFSILQEDQSDDYVPVSLDQYQELATDSEKMQEIRDSYRLLEHIDEEIERLNTELTKLETERNNILENIMRLAGS